MSDIILNIINEYVEAVKKIFGTYLMKVIVYGSYARGDYNEKSDIDIMFIVTLDENKIHETFNEVCDITFFIHPLFHWKSPVFSFKYSFT